MAAPPLPAPTPASSESLGPVNLKAKSRLAAEPCGARAAALDRSPSQVIGGTSGGAAGSAEASAADLREPAVRVPPWSLFIPQKPGTLTHCREKAAQTASPKEDRTLSLPAILRCA